MKYEITKTTDGYIHRVEFTDSNGTREYSCILPFDYEVTSVNRRMCVFCGIRGKFYCDAHQDEKRRYSKYIRELKTFYRTGYIHGISPELLREKTKATNLKRYGVENPFQSDEVKHQIIQTNRKRYGVDHPMHSDVIREKTKATNLKRYGVENPNQSPVIRDKTKATNLQRYGVECLFQSNEHKDKIKATNLKRYGVENPMHSDAIKDKIKATNRKRYGVDHPMHSDVVKDKIKSTNLKRHGVECLLQSPVIRDKTKATNLKRYGVENPNQSPVIREKTKATNLKRYGVEHACQSSEIKEKLKIAQSIEYYGIPDIMEWRDGFVSIMKHNGITEALAAYPKIGYQTALKYFIPDDMKGTGSIAQQDVQKQLEALTDIKFETNIRSIVPNNNKLEIDLLNRDHKISIEFNGLYWHKDIQQRDIDKANAMRDSGYQHIILDETDLWLNKLPKIADMISLNKIHLYARQCKIKEIDSKTAKSFNDSYHLQGHAGAPIRYGLFHNNMLIQVMTFGKPRYDKQHDYELIRLCTKHGYTITGGAEKLFKHFRKIHSNPSVISYSDFKYFSGDVYNRLGMNFVRLNPYGYVWFKDGIVLKRYQTMKHKLNDLLDNFDPNFSEAWNMENNKYIKIPDLGQKVFSTQL